MALSLHPPQRRSIVPNVLILKPEQDAMERLHTAYAIRLLLQSIAAGFAAN